MRYFLELRYHGAAYCGWQRQREAPSVQQAVEEALSTLLRAPVEVTGAGRTDAGVHAAYYVAHFDAPEAVADRTAWCYHLNALLPPDIAVRSLTPVGADAHARFDAVRREYKYYMEFAKNPFSRGVAWQYAGRLDLQRMNRAAEHLLAARDFTSFAKLHSGNRNNICELYAAHWEPNGQGVVFTIAADRFLRNMVRAIVGTLVDVGRGKLTPERFGQIVAARDLSLSSASAPAQGLFLTQVRYPEAVFRPCDQPLTF